MIPFRRLPGEIRELEEATAPGFDLLSLGFYAHQPYFRNYYNFWLTEWKQIRISQSFHSHNFR